MDFIEIIKKNKESDPEAYDNAYGILVERFLRKRYSQRMMEAIVNNYLDDPDNESYVKDFKELQEYRKICKETVRSLLGKI